MKHPKNEMELIARFISQAEANGFEIIELGTRFPDAKIRKNRQEYRAEFEHKSSNFWEHGHDPLSCDIIICWLDDDECPILPVLALSEKDWGKQEITLLDPQQKTARYWKARALIAESQLQVSTKKTDTPIITSTESRKIWRNAKEDRYRSWLKRLISNKFFINFVDEQELSMAEAYRLVFNKEYKYDGPIKDILESIQKIDNQLSEIKRQLGDTLFTILYSQVHEELTAWVTERKARLSIRETQLKLEHDSTINNPKTNNTRVEWLLEVEARKKLFITLVKDKGLSKSQACKIAYNHPYTGGYVPRLRKLLGEW